MKSRQFTVKLEIQDGIVRFALSEKGKRKPIISGQDRFGGPTIRSIADQLQIALDVMILEQIHRR